VLLLTAYKPNRGHISGCNEYK